MKSKFKILQYEDFTNIEYIYINKSQSTLFELNLIASFILICIAAKNVFRCLL